MKEGDRVTVRVVVDGEPEFKRGRIDAIYPGLERSVLVKLDEFWISSDEVRVHPDDVIVEGAST